MPECKEMLFFVPYGSKVLIRFPFRTLFDYFSFAVMAPGGTKIKILKPKRLNGFVPRVGCFLLGVGFALWLLQASPSCLMNWF